MKKPDAGEPEPSPVLDYRPTAADQAQGRRGPARVILDMLALLGLMLLWVVLASLLFGGLAVVLAGC